MAKFYGAIGYVETVETEPGIWEEKFVERHYSGDVIENFLRYQSSGGINEDLNISNKISIISDPYANENSHAMRYIEFMGSRWKITNIEVKYPRLILSIGGVFNGEPIPATDDTGESSGE